MCLRNVLITGASSGIGKAIKIKLEEEGHQVWGISRSGDFPIDLREVETVGQKVENILKTHSQIDTLICNAGMGRFGNLEEFSYDQIKEVIDLNFLSHAMLVKAILGHLKRKDTADIIFMGSEAALQGKKKGSIYCASKFSIKGFAQALREECASSNVRVQLLQPGMVQSPFFQGLDFEASEEALQVEDVANFVVWSLAQPQHVVFEEVIFSSQKKCYQKKKSHYPTSTLNSVE